MENILKMGDKIMFIKEKLAYVVIGTSRGEKRHWANGDNKLIVGFIKDEEGFRQFAEFLTQSFGIFFKKTKCLYGDNVPAYEVVGMMD